jgi:hypothetical protein
MAQRRNSHLSKVEIRDIVSAYCNGEAKSAIATRLSIDHSTVIYHIRRYEKTYVEEPTVYALIKAQMRKKCAHPSKKCMLCGMAEDRLRTHDAEEIRTLSARLKRANERLARSGMDVE